LWVRTEREQCHCPSTCRSISNSIRNAMVTLDVNHTSYHRLGRQDMNRERWQSL
jgi:hypothetical protein